MLINPLGNFAGEIMQSKLDSTKKTKQKEDTGYFSNGYQPNNMSGVKLEKYGKTIKQTSMKGSKNLKGSSMDDQQIWQLPNGTLWIWVGMDGESTINPLDGLPTSGYYQLVGEDGELYDNATAINFSKDQGYTKFKNHPHEESYANPFPAKEVLKDSSNVSPNVSAPSYSAPSAPSNNKQYEALTKEIDKLKEMYAEATRVWSADEVAKHLGIDYNEANILEDFNKQTNEYYDNAIAEQQALRNDYIKNNANYIQELTDAYIDSNKYVAPTATNRGIQAANLMNTNMSADTTNSTNDYGMYQNILNQEEYRKAELANNPNLAKKAYNELGTLLSNWSANKNTSDIKQYIDQLDSYTNYYAADRAYQAYLSQANAAKYAGLAGAAQNYAYNAAQQANSQANNFAQLWNYYYNTSNKNASYASNTVANLLNGSTGQ